MIRFCEEAALRSGVNGYPTSLAQPISLPTSWDHFRTALIDARTVTAHDRYVRWYKDSFRGKKRTCSGSSLVTSNSSVEAGSAGNKRIANGERRWNREWAP